MFTFIIENAEEIKGEPSPVLIDLPYFGLVPIGSFAEIMTGLVALVALSLSIFALVISDLSSRRQAFFAFEERLHSSEATAGRREVYQLKNIDDVKALRKLPDRWDTTNNAINLLNNLAQYARFRIVSRRLVIRQWGDSVSDAWPHLEVFIRFRRQETGRQKLSSLVWLARKSGVNVAEDL
ncbi:DUF4760 domain-containing protein [Microcella sp.]|uniref:DUF4760 domain-containing protein n=1 Tax=Microcella sp. TaxID=1913979 RepID=UPI003F71C7EA